jgi:hypothetical protein
LAVAWASAEPDPAWQRSLKAEEIIRTLLKDGTAAGARLQADAQLSYWSTSATQQEHRVMAQAGPLSGITILDVPRIRPRAPALELDADREHILSELRF